MVRPVEKGLSPGERGALHRFSGKVIPQCAIGRDQPTRFAIARKLLTSPVKWQLSGLKTFQELCRNNTFLGALNAAGLRLYAIGSEEAPLLLSSDTELLLGRSLHVMQDQTVITLHLSSAKYYDFARQSIVNLTPVAVAAVPPPEPATAPSPLISVAVLPPKPVVEHELDLCGLVGVDSPKIQEALTLVRKICKTELSIVVTGPTGAGKELFAKMIHANGPRKDRQFMAINCSALPETLLESELFGHERGAYTGADAKRIGYFEHAADGTVFLDEIGEMPLPMQVKLLRVLQEKEFRRLGGNQMIKTNARIIAATNKNLVREIAARRFREDLYYRLNVIEIGLPSLRERPEDILTLARHFLANYAQVHGKQFKNFSPEIAAALLGHPWPGNVREMQNCLQRAVVLAENEIALKDLGLEPVDKLEV